MRTALLCAFPLVALMAAAIPAGAQATAPPKLPANANAIMRVEVAKLLASPMAKEQGWQAKLMKGYADRPLAVPPTAQRVTVVAGMNAVGMRTIWQAAVIELTSPVRLDPMLKAQGGYLDQIGGKQAAWTPRDVFYVQFGPNTLGVLQPGQRQFLTRWVAPEPSGTAELSPYLKGAWDASSSADVLFAIDLDDMVGATAIRYADSMGKFPSLDKLQDDDARLFAGLASAKGVRLSVKVDSSITGELVADFDQEVGGLKDNATAFVRDVLNNADISDLGLEKWQFTADGKRIAGKGELDADSLSRLIAILAPAHAEDAVTISAGTISSSDKQSGESTKSGDPKQDAAQASQKYFRAVASTLDSISKSSSPTQVGSAFINKARRIEQLPILNVDPALVDWGNLVAESFNRAAQELGIGQRKADAAAQGVASPTAYATYTNQGGGNATADTRAAYRNAAQQRRQVSQAERAAAADRAFAIMNQVLPTRGKIRAEMTQKYGVEF